MKNTTTQKLNLFSFLLAFCLMPISLFSQFTDGFESGTYLPTWSDGTGTYTRTVTTVAPGAGTYSFELTGGMSSHYDGIIGNFTNTQPAEISWMVKGAATAYCGYVVVGDANVSSNNGMVFSRLSNNGNLNFYANAGAQYDHPISGNTWYLVELKNIDWTSKVFDIYVDGVLAYTGFPFRDPATNGLSEFHFYNYNAGTAYLDAVSIGPINNCNNPTIPTITYTPDPVCFGDDATLTITGTLNDATDWFVYSGSCGGTLLGSTATSTFVVTPPALGETYYIRGEDGAGCVDEAVGQCGSITVLMDTTAPIPDSISLVDVIDMCSANPTAPTATDICDGAVTGVPDVTLPVTTIGTSMITWTFTDGDGYTSQQTQNIIITGVDVTTSLNAFTISANNTNGTYQWIDCANGSPIAGATNQDYTATMNGNYAVIVTEGACSDTSSCVTISTIGIDPITLQSFVLFPNPSKDGMFSVKIDGEIKSIEVIDMLGRVIQLPIDLQKGSVNASQLASGKYMVRVTIQDDQVLIKEIVIQK